MRHYSRSLYDKEVLLKAAYSLTDRYYIHLDADEEGFCVGIRSKSDGSTDTDDGYGLFDNAIVVQQTRKVVSERTANIREMIVARALSSSMIVLDGEDKYENELHQEGEERNTGDSAGFEDEIPEQDSADNILKDWFETHEE